MWNDMRNAKGGTPLPPHLRASRKASEKRKNGRDVNYLNHYFYTVESKNTTSDLLTDSVPILEYITGTPL